MVRIRTLYICVVLLTGISLFFVFLPGRSCAHPEGGVLRLSDGAFISFEAMMTDLYNVDVVFVGESHDSEIHHRLQLNVIRDLTARNIPVSIGLEMFMTDQQPELDSWVAGKLDVQSFRNVYLSYWPLSWHLYSDIFEFARDQGIPLVALNVPKSVTRKVASGGLRSLSDEEIELLPPDITCEEIDETYAAFIRKAYDSHGNGDEAFIFFCEAQMVWDKAMAWNLLDYLDLNQGRRLVALAGIGHAWKRGMPQHILNYSDYVYRVVLPEVPGRIGTRDVTVHDADYLLLE